MKKLYLVLAAFLLLAPTAFALQCKEGNLGSDECWTNVEVSYRETTPVTQGVVLVYDFDSWDNSIDNIPYRVRVANASADWTHVAGVAQKTIATGDSGLVLVRGQGKVRVKTSSTIASKDAIYVATSADVGVTAETGAKPIGVMLVNQSASGSTSATLDAFISIV